MDKIVTEANKRNNGTLPVVKAVKVKVNRNTVNADGKRQANGFIVLVEIEGRGWFNENAVLHHYGFKTVSGTFKTYEKAKLEADGIMAKWGKTKAAKKAAKKIDDIIGGMTEDQRNDLLAKLIAAKAA